MASEKISLMTSVTLAGLDPADVYIPLVVNGDTVNYKIASSDLVQLLGIRGLGAGSIQIGEGANASGTNSVAIGTNAIASGNNAIAIGKDAQALKNDTLVIGRDAIANGTRSVAVGHTATADPGSEGSASTSVGYGAATAFGSVAVGETANATLNSTLAIGNGAVSGYNAGAIAIGSSAAAGTNAIAIGNNLFATGENSISLGVEATTANTIAMAVGGSAGSVLTQTATANEYTAVP